MGNVDVLADDEVEAHLDQCVVQLLVTDAALELENNKLKKLLSERMLDIEVLKDVNSKKW